MMQERRRLAIARVKGIREESRLEPPFTRYFQSVAEFLLMVEENRQQLEKGLLRQASLEELKARNEELYRDVLPEYYTESYGNPKTARERLGEGYGQILSALYAEERSLIVYSYAGAMSACVIRLELFLLFYTAFLEAAEEGGLPEVDRLKEIYYWFACDYAEALLEDAVSRQFEPEGNYVKELLEESDLSDLRYLYRYGEYVTHNEHRLASYMNALPEETVALMADTYTEGYRKGFEVARKDLSRKKTVNIIYALGMERMVKKAMENFRAMGLTAIPYPAPVSFMGGRKLYKNGISGAVANRQFEYDHEYDLALYLDARYCARKLDAYKGVLEKYREQTSLMGGPAVIEKFGEPGFVPEQSDANLRLDEQGQKCFVEYQSAARTLLNRYVKGEERSFTIIAFPVPAIGEKFEDAFEETIRLNTLDYELYKRCQQAIIDVLDGAAYVRIRGAGKNRTDLKVALPPLADPGSQTNFENCVADVNIPVGEVFTSPKLEGTKGVLHVPEIFLQGLEYLDLELVFEDGCIVSYGCANFESKEEGRKLIRENLLHNHDTLPMGEFAIGTNTTAYMAAKRLQIADVLPILIAEKMGSHFAIGDTCFSREEEVETFNPDGKKMMAKENAFSAQRKTDSGKAYFNCHTDITIPYNELEAIVAVDAGGGRTPIILNGRFVLPGSEELNKPFDE